MRQNVLKEASTLSKPDKRQARTALFITAAQKLIEENGIKDLSVRKIAERAGYHNSTIYAYFKDEDILLSLACVPFFNDYAKALARLSASNPTSYDSFFSIWEYFCISAFNQPDAFQLFFFGKYSNSLTELFDRYYELFPNEKVEYPQNISEMYYGNNFEERCYKILSPLIQDSNTRITTENCTMVNSVIASVFKTLLAHKCVNTSSDNKKSIAWFMQVLHFLVDC